MRKYLILFHRYLGIALSLVFVSWFASGIAMLYARGMPRLTPDLRLERLAPVDMSAVRLSAAAAALRAALDAPLAPARQPEFAHLRAALGADLGESAFAAAWAAGEALSWQEAVAEALRE